MILYPTIELLGGRCVTVDAGDVANPVIWHRDPVEVAREFAAAGARWMHLTDFDAMAGRGDNADLVAEIIRAAGIPVQLGGGMRSREAVEHWIDRGAGRVVVGTLAARDPRLVRELAVLHPDQIVLAVDVYRGQVMTDRLRAPSAITPERFIEGFGDAPFAALKITDFDSDQHGVEAQLGVISGLARISRLPVIASGVIHGIDDISRVAYLPNLAGVLVGRALFNRAVDLGAALALAAAPREKAAEFL